MTEQERLLRERLQTLHDAADDVNAEHGTIGMLCLMCDARHYTAHVGIVHQSECALLLARTALQETGE